MKRKTPALGFLLLVLVLHGSAFAQQSFDTRAIFRQQAIAQGKIKEYLAAAEASAAEAEKAQRWADAADAYAAASTAARQMGQLQTALRHATSAIGLAQKAKDARLVTRSMDRLADVHRTLGQRDKEREWLEKALDAAKEIKPRDNWSARLYSQLGANFLQEGGVEKAIEYTSSSVQMLENELSRRRGTRAAANPNQNMLLINAFNQVGSAYNQLGNAYLKAGKTLEAIKTFEKGLAVIKDSGRDYLQAEENLTVNLGKAYLEYRNFPRASQILTKALDTAEARGQTSQIQKASSAIADIFLLSAKPSEAIPYYNKALATVESTRSLLESEEFRTSFFENKGRIYGGLILAYLETSNVEEAFNYNERARSRAFLDILGSKVQLGRQGALLEEERALQAKIAVSKASLAGEGRGDEEEAETDQGRLRQDLEAAQKAYTDFLAKVRKENREQASLMDVEPLTLKRVQELLDPGMTVLEYFVDRGTVWLWVVEKDRVNFVSTSIARADLLSKVNLLRESIYRLGEKGKVSAFSQELYRLLIEPALSHIRGKELIIIPHGVLHYLPFQALLSPQGKYLIEDYPINYLSSASLMQFTQEKRKPKGELTSVLAKGGNVLALGNPDLGDPAMSLRFAELEVREVQRLYPQSTVLLKTEATEEKAKGLSPQNDIIHFASHAELEENDPLASAILLAKSDKEDGRLEVREIFGMDLKASLVVLSACETGLGKLSSGDELVGLTRAFIYAGTPSVMASLWKVEDSSTATLMASFYRNLKTMTKVEALRQAQLELIKGQASSDLLVRRGIGGIGKLGETQQAKSEAASSVPASISTSHPYFWAPFILVGDGK